MFTKLDFKKISKQPSSKGLRFFKFYIDSYIFGTDSETLTVEIFFKIIILIKNFKYYKKIFDKNLSN